MNVEELLKENESLKDTIEYLRMENKFLLDKIVLIQTLTIKNEINEKSKN